MTAQVTPRGQFQELCFEGEAEFSRANPLLVFAVRDNLFDPQIKFGTSVDPVYKYFAGYRLSKETRTQGVFSLGTSPTFEAYKAVQAQKIAAMNKFIASVRVDAGSSTDKWAAFNKAAKGILNLPVPEIPFTDEPRVLPAGSLLLCRSDADGDKWFSLTPEEQDSTNLMRSAGEITHEYQEIPLSSRPFTMGHDFGPGKDMFVQKLPVINREAHRKDMYERWLLTVQAKAQEISPKIT